MKLIPKILLGGFLFICISIWQGNANSSSHFFPTSENIEAGSSPAMGLPAPFTATVTTEDVICFGESSGKAYVSVTGGTPPYKYQWINTSVLPITTVRFVTSSNPVDSLIGIPESNYWLIIEDDDGTRVDKFFTITEPPQLTLENSMTNITCRGANDGTITIYNVFGGNGGYTYSINGGLSFVNNGGFFDNLGPGSYSVVVRDSKGCLANGSTFNITNPAQDLTVTVDRIRHCTCYGADNGSIEISVTGGEGPYVISWTGTLGFSSSDEDIFNLEPDVYTLTVTDSRNCVKGPYFFNIIEPAEITITSENSTDVTCNGADNGTITVTATGGTGTRTYTLNPGAISNTTGVFTNLAPGTNYVVTVTDVRGCGPATSSTFTISEPPAISITSESFTHITCNGANDGTITVTATGGTGTLTYTLNPGAISNTTGVFTSLGPGTNYVVSVTDDNGCGPVSSSTLTILEPDPVIITTVIDSISCNGANDGAIEATITGGTIPYTYAWTGPSGFTANTARIENLQPGTYNLTVTDDNACTEILNPGIDLIEPAILNVVVDSAAGPKCYNTTNGYIHITVTGGTSPYNYSWTGPFGYISYNEDINNLRPGSYALTVTDAHGCTFVLPPVTINPAPFINIIVLDKSDVLCYGDDDGYVITDVSGGTGPLDVLWSGPNGFTSTDTDIYDLPGGVYTILVTDSLGCTNSLNIRINEPLEYSLTLDEVGEISCYGADDGYINITINGGSAPYAVLWTGSNGFSSTDEDISNLAPADYDIIVTDNALCSASLPTVSLSEPAELVVNVDEVSNTRCYNTTDGYIHVTVAGGTSPYNYAWTGPFGYVSNDEDINNLSPGSYVLTVTDAHGCNVVLPAITIDPAAFINITVLDKGDVQCYGDDDGYILMDVSGGTGPLDVLWTGPNGYTSTDTDIYDLSGGIYTILVTDAQGCTNSLNIQVNEPLEEYSLTLDEVGEVSCYGADDGYINITINGGNAPYAILWTGSNGFSSIDEDISNLAPADYDIIVTDNALCSASLPTISLAQPAELVVNVDEVADFVCHDTPDIHIYTTISGGTTPYDIAWTGPDGFTSSSDDIDNLQPGDYDLSVTDARGCSVVIPTITITKPDTLQVTVNVTAQVSCYGDNDGTILVTTTGGTTPYNFAWTGPGTYTNTTEDITGLSPGEYNLTVTDDHGCIVSIEPVTITEPPELVLDHVGFNDVACHGDDNGNISLEVYGGTEPYLYSINNGLVYRDYSTFTGLSGGIYTVLVKDNNDCTVGGNTITIEEPDEIFVNVSTQNASCAPYSTLGPDGEITITASGGDPSYEYSIDGGLSFGTSNHFENLYSNYYIIVVKDNNNCEKAVGATVGTDVMVDARIAHIDESGYHFVEGVTICPETDEVFLASGGDSIVWSPSYGLNDSTLANVIVNLNRPVRYTAYVYQGTCYDWDTIKVKLHPLSDLTITTDSAVVRGAGTILNAVLYNHVPIDSFRWSPSTFVENPNWLSTWAFPENNMTYVAYLRSTYGCVETDTIRLKVMEDIQIPSGFTPNGDGTNEKWEIPSAIGYPEMTVEVFTRWGKRVFYAKGYNPSNYWDGTYKGNPLPVGTYYYVVTLNSELINKEPITGTVTILR